MADFCKECSILHFDKDYGDLAGMSTLEDTFKLWVPFGIDTVVNGQNITLCHYCMRVWSKSHFGAYCLHGRSHGTLPDDPNSLSMDVGVDANNFFPVSFNQIKEKMSKKTFKPIDGHRK